MAAMTAEEAAEWGKSLSFEKVWAALMENREQIKAMSAEAAERSAEAAERSAEADRQIKAMNAEAAARNAEAAARNAEAVERGKDIDRRIKELSKNIGGLNRSLGKSTEYMFNARMWEKFNALEYTFTKGAPNVKFLENGQIIAESDMFMENGEYVMPVEIKTDLTKEDVDEHIERIKTIRRYMDTHNDKRTIVGAVAGTVVPDGIRAYAHKKGLYVMIPSGKAVAVADMPAGFTAAKWPAG